MEYTVYLENTMVYKIIEFYRQQCPPPISGSDRKLSMATGQ